MRRERRTLRRKGSMNGKGRMSVQARFGDNLRECRRQAGLSQERLAAVSGLHRTEISLLERGARDPRLTTIARLARALGTDSDVLVTGVAPPAD